MLVVTALAAGLVEQGLGNPQDASAIPGRQDDRLGPVGGGVIVAHPAGWIDLGEGSAHIAGLMRVFDCPSHIEDHHALKVPACVNGPDDVRGFGRIARDHRIFQTGLGYLDESDREVAVVLHQMGAAIHCEPERGQSHDDGHDSDHAESKLYLKRRAHGSSTRARNSQLARAGHGSCSSMHRAPRVPSA